MASWDKPLKMFSVRALFAVYHQLRDLPRSFAFSSSVAPIAPLRFAFLALRSVTGFS